MKQLLIAVAMLVAATLHAEEPNLAAKLQEVSVTVYAAHSQGSGTVIVRDGQSFVLTAGHVVAANRRVVPVLIGGSAALVVRYSPVIVVRELYSGGRSVAALSVEAQVVAYSSSEFGHDLALLQLRGPITSSSAEFSANDAGVGSDVALCASPLGQLGSGSYTIGVISQIGRVLYGRVFDQTSVAVLPGSSGGGLFLRSNGQWVGMVVRRFEEGDSFNLIVPIRRVRQWAKAQHCDFIFDPKSHVNPSEIILENAEPITTSDSVDESKYKTS